MIEVIFVLGIILVVVVVVVKVRGGASGQDKKQQEQDKGQKEKGKQTAGTSVIEMEVPEKVESKPAKKKKKKSQKVDAGGCETARTNKELEQIYKDQYYGTVSLRSSKNICTITSLTVKNSKILFATSKNQLQLYDLKKWKAHSTCSDHYYTSLDNNSATAVAIGGEYYFAALDFQKTIVYYEFKGGEGGVYFREVKRFPRGIFKGNQGSMSVPEGQRFIVTTGMQSDTSINVWSMQGERLATVGSYQIEHYEIRYTNSLVLVRGWTSEVKAFQLETNKDGSFNRIEKGFHLTLSQKPLASVIDVWGLNAVAISGDGELIKLWHLNHPLHPNQVTIDGCQVGMDQPQHCAIATLKMENQRLKTLVLVAGGGRMVLLDRNLQLVRQFEGVAVQSLTNFGATRSAVFGSYSSGKLSVWDFTKLANEQPEYVQTS